MPYSELVKSLNPIRSYMRDFFVYGFKNRSDFPESQRRSYDNEKRRMESWLADYMTFHMDQRRKNSYLSIDTREVAANPLHRVFLAKSFTDMDVALHFFLLDILADGTERTTGELWDTLTTHYPLSDVPDESTIRKKCKEYTALGLLEKWKAGRNVYYRLMPSLDASALPEALRFAAETLPLGAVGCFLTDGRKSPIPMAFKHHYLFAALDEEILELLFAAISEKREVSLLLPHEKEIIVFPWKIYSSTESGRQYLFGLSDRKPIFCRLDRIEMVKSGDVDPAAADKERFLAEKLSHLWGVSGGDWETVYRVEMVIRVKASESFVIERLERERRCGRVSRLAPGRWKWEARVFDPLEMLPWIRTFIGRIESLTSDHPTLEKRFRKDLAAMWQFYEKDGHDDI